MVPALVFNSTGIGCGGKHGLAGEGDGEKNLLHGCPVRGPRAMSGEAFVDLPATAFLEPVLAFLENVGKIVAAVVLFEGDDNQIFFARTTEDAQLASSTLIQLLPAVTRRFCSAHRS
jgi:hypothetical protein